MENVSKGMLFNDKGKYLVGYCEGLLTAYDKGEPHTGQIALYEDVIRELMQYVTEAENHLDIVGR